jgi:hypothetical protein
MKDENPIVAFFGGFMVGVGALALILLGFSQHTAMYKDGVRDTQKEAFDNGLIVKEITKDDQVIYRWLEIHKQSEE